MAGSRDLVGSSSFSPVTVIDPFDSATLRVLQHCSETSLLRVICRSAGLDVITSCLKPDIPPSATSCPGCSYYSHCCCAPTGRQAKRTLRVTVAQSRNGRRQILGQSLSDPAGDEADAQDGRLFARNLCPRCPSGAAVKQRTFFDQLMGWTRSGSGSDYSYCCPAPSVATIVVTQTVKFRPPPPPPPDGRGIHRGMIWFDDNGDGKFTPSTDKKLRNTWVLLRTSNGTIIGRAKTDKNGMYKITTSRLPPNTKLIVSLMKNPRKPVQIIKTGPQGNSRFLLPIPPATIRGVAFYDVNRNARNDGTERRLANSYVLLKFANGTVWKRIPTDAKGRYVFPYGRKTGLRYPFEKLTVSAPDGTVLRSFRLDAVGNGIEDVPIPPVCSNIMFIPHRTRV